MKYSCCLHVSTYVNVLASQSDEDEALDPVDPEPPLPTPDTAATTESDPEPEPGLQEKVQETQAPGSLSPSPAGCSDPAIPEAVSATSKAHLFIFDSESQEEESQSVLADHTAAPVKPQPAADKDSAFSLTQIQLEEDKQRIRELMEDTNQVTCTLFLLVFLFSGQSFPFRHFP